MAKIKVIAFGCLLVASTASAQWSSTGDANRGTQFYTSAGVLGYSIRTAAGGGWLWQFVDASNNSYFNVQYPTGNVGIGNLSPDARLVVNGLNSEGLISKFAADGSSNSAVQVKNNLGFLNIGIGASGATSGYGYLWGSTGKVMIGSDGNPSLVVDGMSNGKIGIGTAAPYSRIDVNGWGGPVINFTNKIIDADYSDIISVRSSAKASVLNLISSRTDAGALGGLVFT